jgi:hypothetical protein
MKQKTEPNNNLQIAGIETELNYQVNKKYEIVLVPDKNALEYAKKNIKQITKMQY